MYKDKYLCVSIVNSVAGRYQGRWDKMADISNNCFYKGLNKFFGELIQRLSEQTVNYEFSGYKILYNKEGPLPFVRHAFWRCLLCHRLQTKWRTPGCNDIPFHTYNVTVKYEYLQVIQVFWIGHICTFRTQERSREKIES
jgi:hypothetical protein